MCADRPLRVSADRSNVWVLKHLPNVLHVEDQYVNLLSPIDCMSAEYEDCVLRIMVQEELYPITEQTAAGDLAQSFCETFQCMYSFNTCHFATVHHFGYRLQMAI